METLLPIKDIAAKAGLKNAYEPYGHYMAKIDPNEIAETGETGKLILVTALTPTKAGEGKTTTSIALAEGFGAIGQKAMLCLREPALGPVFGMKGGATGGGKASIGPKEDINLHFTGDMHCLTSSINLISAVLDNSLHFDNPLNIDPSRIVWKRAMDMNDRALRDIEIGNGRINGPVRKDGFIITVASELMAILCLAKDPNDFLERLKKIIVAYTYDGKEVTVEDLRCTHAVMRLMKNAFKPNLVQTYEGEPCLVHGGPFANIAHGCNSLIATKMALKIAPIVITEAGFGADLGAEKFLNIACQEGKMNCDLVVMVATIRALKCHGGVPFEELTKKNVEVLSLGMENLKTHLENMKKFGVNVLIAINHFASDDADEIAYLEKWCAEEGYPYSFVDAFEKGGEGAKDLAEKALECLKEESHYHPLYKKEEDPKSKIEKIAKEIYRAEKVEYSELAEKQLKEYVERGYGDSYICMAKTPQSLSDDPSLIGAPKGTTLHIREVNLSAGASFLVPLTGSILTMPGLPRVPSAIKMEDEEW